MTVDHSTVTAPKGGSKPAAGVASVAPAQVLRAMVLISTVAGFFAAAVAMLAVGVTVRLVADQQPGGVKMVILAVGTAVGAVATVWPAQPLLTRLAHRYAAASERVDAASTNDGRAET